MLTALASSRSAALCDLATLCDPATLPAAGDGWLTSLAATTIEVRFSPWALVGAGVCLLVGTFGAVLGTSLLVHSPTKLTRRWGEAGATALEYLRQHEAELVATARAMSILGGAGTCLFAMAIGGNISPYLSVGLAALALLALCAAVPPALAATRAESVVARGWPWLRAAHTLLRLPLIVPARAFAQVLLRALRVPEQPPEDPAEIAEDILAAVADTSRDALEAEEKTWIANIVDLKDLQVSAIMTPRTDIVAIPADQSLAEAVQRITETGHSRYPVHAGRVDEVIGVLYAKDVVAVVSSGGSLREQRVRDTMRKPLFVPETMGVADLLSQLKQAKVHMAIVLDEYGGTAGLITVEDILEEIVGDIADEHDDDTESPLRVVAEQSILEVSGRTRVGEVNSALAVVELPEHDDYDTVAGYLFSKLGRIPLVGEKVEVDGIEFTVLRGDARRIDRLRLRVLQRQDSATVRP